jgi:hypothetical protein
MGETCFDALQMMFALGIRLFATGLSRLAYLTAVCTKERKKNSYLSH